MKLLSKTPKPQINWCEYYRDKLSNAQECAFLVIGSILLATMFLLMFSFCGTARAEVNSERAILAIIGEAEDQGYEGMLAVACAIRNRDTIKGVYGINSPRIKQKKYSMRIYQAATKAWKESKLCDVTKGATHWENIKAFGKPYWVKSMIKTYSCKDHVFYKEAI